MFYSRFASLRLDFSVCALKKVKLYLSLVYAIYCLWLAIGVAKMF